jgi:hypothetical protein
MRPPPWSGSGGTLRWGAGTKPLDPLPELLELELPPFEPELPPLELPLPGLELELVPERVAFEPGHAARATARARGRGRGMRLP